MRTLYTNLIRAKQLLGGEVPPMTPLPPAIVDIIDPLYVPGLGSLEEDPNLGLRCPIRDCGKHYQNLGQHLTCTHKDIGGASQVKKMLSIAPNTPLLSQRLLGARKATFASNTRIQESFRESGRRQAKCLNKQKTKVSRRNRSSVGERNWRLKCDGQFLRRFQRLQEQTGREPAIKDAEVLDPKLFEAVRYAYGTWNNAKAHYGLAVRPTGRGNKMTLQFVLDSL